MLSGKRIGWYALPVASLGKNEQLSARVGNSHGHHKVSLAGEADADHATGGASHRPRLALMESAHAPLARGKNEVILTRRRDDLGELIALIKGDGDDPRRTDLLELLKRSLFDNAALCRKGEIASRVEVIEDDRGDRRLARLNLHPWKVDDRNPLVLSRRVGNFVHLGAEAAAAIRKEECEVVGVGDEERSNSILFARRHANDTLAAAMLLAIRCQRLALDVATAADCDYDIFVGDQIFVRHLTCCVVGDSRSARVPKFLFELCIFGGNNLRDARRLPKDVFEFGDEFNDLEVLLLNLLALESGKSRKAHVEDCLRLKFAQLELLHKLRARHINIGSGANRLNDSVKIVEGDFEPLKDVRALTRLLQFKLCAAANDDAAMLNVMLNDAFERERLWLAVNERKHVEAERGAKWRELQQAIENLVRIRVALHLNVDAHPIAVGLVAQVGDSIEALFFDQIGNLLDECRFVYLVRKLGDDDGGAIAARRLFEMR